MILLCLQDVNERCWQVDFQFVSQILSFSDQIISWHGNSRAGIRAQSLGAIYIYFAFTHVRNYESTFT